MPTPTIRARLTRLDYETFLTLIELLALVWGAWVGVLGLVMALFGADVTANLLGIVELVGIRAGLVGLVWTPLVYVIAAGILSPLLYFPFRWLLQRFGGLRVRVEPDARPQPA